MDTKEESWGWDELGDWDPHIYILLTLCMKKITIENLKKRERDTGGIRIKKQTKKNPGGKKAGVGVVCVVLPWLSSG